MTAVDPRGTWRPAAVLLVRSSAALAVATALLAAGQYAAAPAQVQYTRPGPLHGLVGRGPLNGQVLVPTVEAEQVARWQHLLRLATGRASEILPAETTGTPLVPSPAEQMRISQHQAARLAAALVRAPHQPPVADADGAQVVHVVSGSPAERAGLRAGDVIVAAKDESGHVAIGRADDLHVLAATSSHVMHLMARRGSRETTTHVLPAEQGSSSQDPQRTSRPGASPTQSRLGLVLADFYLPDAQVEASPPGRGGSSAGLLLTLAAYDAQAPGDLLAGKTLSGTGQLSSGGEVGPVVGVRQKARAAADAGAQVFLVPASQAALLREVPRSMTVVPVDTLTQALQWLCAHGGTAPACDAPHTSAS